MVRSPLILARQSGFPTPGSLFVSFAQAQWAATSYPEHLVFVLELVQLVIDASLGQ